MTTVSPTPETSPEKSPLTSTLAAPQTHPGAPTPPPSMRLRELAFGAACARPSARRPGWASPTPSARPRPPPPNSPSWSTRSPYRSSGCCGR